MCFGVFRLISNNNLCFLFQLPEKMTVEVEYKVGEVVFPIGKVVDPITGKRCRGTKFIEELSREDESIRVSQTKTLKNYPL